MRSEQELLLQAARRFHLTHYGDAFGRCFAHVLGVAQAAKRQGLAVELVRWDIIGDRDFYDHWAVSCGEDVVIDPTHVQVDGDSGLLQAVTSYPAHFKNLRRYPAALLLPLFDALDVGRCDHMPFRFMWQSGLALLRHDMRRACRERQWRKLMQGADQVLRFSCRMALGALQHNWIRLPLPQNRMGPRVETSPACLRLPADGSG